MVVKRRWNHGKYFFFILFYLCHWHENCIIRHQIQEGQHGWEWSHGMCHQEGVAPLPGALAAPGTGSWAPDCNEYSCITAAKAQAVQAHSYLQLWVCSQNLSKCRARIKMQDSSLTQRSFQLNLLQMWATLLWKLYKRDAWHASKEGALGNSGLLGNSVLFHSFW